MNYQQYLLVKLAEEASEVAQIAIKCSLFGYDSVDPRENTGETNALKLFKELLDFSAVMTELEDSTDIDIDFNKDKDCMLAYKILTTKMCDYDIIKKAVTDGLKDDAYGDAH